MCATLVCTLAACGEGGGDGSADTNPFAPSAGGDEFLDPSPDVGIGAEENFDDGTGSFEEANSSPGSLTAMLLNERDNVGVDDAWVCSSSERDDGLRIGYSFQGEITNTGYPSGLRLIERPNRSSDTELIYWGETGPDSFEIPFGAPQDVSSITFYGADAWEGFSSTWGRILCDRTVYDSATFPELFPGD